MNMTPDLNGAPMDNALTLRELQRTCRALQTQLLAVLITLVVLNLSINIYLMKQLSLVNKQATELQQSVHRYVSNDAPRMNKFLDQLRVVARAHPDFGAMLNRYNIETNQSSSTVLPP